jgi:hypothetical protein
MERTTEYWLTRSAEAEMKAHRMRTATGRSIALGEAAEYWRLAHEATLAALRRQKVSGSTSVERPDASATNVGENAE